MRDSLEGLKDTFNMQLNNIKVSEELKLKTLEKCKINSDISIHKAFLPITLTIVACLFMGFIVYPIYNENNLLHNGEVAMNTSKKGTKTLEEPGIETAMIKDKANITKEKTNEIVKENKNKGNENSKEQQKKQGIILNDKPIISSKIESSMKNGKKDKVVSNQVNSVSKKSAVDSDKNHPIQLCKNNDLDTNEETKMKTLSLDGAKDFFGEAFKIPSYIPIDFFMEKVLVPEISNNSCELYEIIYSNNSQYFKITEYKNTNYYAGLVENKSLESKVAGENIMIININKIPVKYILARGSDNKQLPYAKLFWENAGEKYSIDGNTPWAELINIAYSIIR